MPRPLCFGHPPPKVLDSACHQSQLLRVFICDSSIILQADRQQEHNKGNKNCRFVTAIVVILGVVLIVVVVTVGLILVDIYIFYYYFFVAYVVCL